MVAYHYPPEGSSSGVLRTLKFSKYLPALGWQPHVLTLREELYRIKDEQLLRDIPPDVVIHRTRAFDATYHLAVRGRYPAVFAVPDRFATWLPFGVARGLRVIRKYRVRVLFSTSPLPTAHLIAASLQSLTRLPWIADFRDPWIEDGLYPKPGSARYHVESVLEALVIRRATRVTVTTEHFRREMLARYPALRPDRIATILNGYDEDDFAGLDDVGPASKFEILHAGLVTPEYRDPLPLLRALRACITRGWITHQDARVVFLGGGPYLESRVFSEAVRELELGDIVQVLGRIPYRATIRRMAGAAVLLLLQASDDTRTLIPAKAFEYLRIGRPILALAGDGATADLVRDNDAGIVTDAGDQAAIESALVSLYKRWLGLEPHGRLNHAHALPFERAALTRTLAEILDSLIPEPEPVNRRMPSPVGREHS